MIRLVYMATSAWFALAVSVLAETNREDALQEAPPTEQSATWAGNPLVLADLSADMHDSEEWIPQIPNPVYTGYRDLETTTTTTTTTTLPPPEWLGNIPEEYGPGSGCTQEKASIIARAMWDRGALDSSVEWMLYVVSRESLCNSDAHNGNRSTGDDSWGLCQQNNLSGWFNEGSLLENYDRFAFADDFVLNAESCAVMWEECGKGPWTRGDYGCSTPKELR